MGTIALPTYLLLSWMIGGDAPLLAHVFRAGLAAAATGLGVASFAGLRRVPRSNRRED